MHFYSLCISSFYYTAMHHMLSAVQLWWIAVVFMQRTLYVCPRTLQGGARPPAGTTVCAAFA